MTWDRRPHLWTWGDSNPRPNSLSWDTLRLFRPVVCQIEYMVNTTPQSLLNTAMISRRIRFKAIYRLSDAFLAPSLVATPSKVFKRLKSLVFHT